jgi:hypothetical protein
MLSVGGGSPIVRSYREQPRPIKRLNDQPMRAFGGFGGRAGRKSIEVPREWCPLGQPNETLAGEDVAAEFLPLLRDRRTRNAGAW